MSGVQLVELGDRELIKRGSFEHEFRARRARLLGDAVVSISGRSLKSLDVTDRDHPRLLAELTLAWPADLVHRVGDVFIQLERGPGYFWYGSGTETPARLHVSPVDDPDELLGSLDLPDGRIAGSFQHGDCLFVAQQLMTQEQVEGQFKSSETFTTTVIDLGDPDRPLIVGRASKTTTNTGYHYGFGADYRGALLPDGSLAWYPAQQNYYFWLDPIPLGPVADLGGDVIYPYFPTSGRVYTVAIANKTQPAILASVELASPANAWPEGEIRLVGATLFHGLQQSETELQPDGSTKWYSRHLLGHVDLSNPAAPVAGELVKLPGTFEHALGTPARGTVLFTTTQRYFQEADNNWRSEFRVQALAFDGVQAFLIEELVVPDWSYGPKIFHERFLVLGSTDYSTAGGTTALTIHEWLNSGSFGELQTLQLNSPVNNLDVNDHLLVARGAALTFIDFVDPADPDPALVTFPAVNFWQRLDLIDVHQRQFAHLPLGLSGVRTLDFGSAFDGSTPAPPTLPSQNPQPEWQTVPLSLLAATSPGHGLLLDALPDGADWLFDNAVAQVDYESWTRLALGLAPPDPVPSPSLDTDFDGQSNAWEYFTGTNPGDPGDVSPFLVAVTTAENGTRYLTGFLSINPHATASLRVAGEASVDLVHWDDSPGSIDFMAEPFHPGVVLRLSKPVQGGEGFLRAVLSNSLP